MSGMACESPGVRFSPRIRLRQVLLRALTGLLIRWRSSAARQFFRKLHRLEVAEFPAPTPTAFERLEWILRDRRGTGRASSDALRPNDNSVNTKVPYGNSIIRKRLAASARWLFPPARGRSLLPAQFNSPQSSTQTNPLGEIPRLVFQWQAAHRARPIDAA